MKTTGLRRFFNRELSWLEFNQRVLDEALNPKNPLLERLKFFCITASNLDEFFEIRVAGIKQQIESDVVERSLGGLTASQTFRALTRRVRELVEQQYACWRDHLKPALAKHGLRILDVGELSSADLAWAQRYYHAQVHPVLTPLALDPAHPFPQLLNKSLNFIVQAEVTKGGQKVRHLAVVPVPRVLPRLVSLPRDDARQDYLLLGQLIGFHLTDLFPGTSILGYWHFRVTRNSELYIDDEEVANLLKAVETELYNRRKGDAVRLELDSNCPLEIRQTLLSKLRLQEEDLYAINGPLAPGPLMALYEGDHSPELRDPPFVAPIARGLRTQSDLFAAIRQRDHLLHHPYESYESVVRFLEQAAEDPRVLAIKQTLYRTGRDQRMIGALMNAVNHGKQVTVVVELRARFDEANNIEWARQLEEAGVHVVYGLVGFKIHSKICLVVRRDDDGIRRYVHFGTGNYNPTTARLYTDLSLLTCHPDFGEDATNLFNLLTGIAQFKSMRRLVVTPFELHDRILSFIERETDNAKRRLPARIIAKMNALIEDRVIEALYRASQAGVQIDLIVRGTCCLRAGVAGLSENIRVRSIVDRFLEHSRIFYFENACQPEVFISSADWMPRNFFRRIEVAVPILDGVLRDRLISEILAVSLADNLKARILQPDGRYICQHPAPRQKPIRSQFELMALASGDRPGRSPKGSSSSAYPKMQLAPRPGTVGRLP
ncbi:MAG: polyphosphate kinase 1 [Verrucomicrobiia bacterium]